jgi:hypothetical protein
MTLREVFHETQASRLYRFIHFPRPASEWTLDMEVLVEQPDPNEPDHPVQPHPVAAGYESTTFSSDIEHIVHHADRLCRCTADEERLSALRFYYNHGRRVFEDWLPAKERV